MGTYHRMLASVDNRTRRTAQRRGSPAPPSANPGAHARAGTIPRTHGMAADERHDWDKATSPLTRRG